MPVIPYKDFTPQIKGSAFIAPTAWVTGQCFIDEDVSIFFGAVLRGDIQKIIVGKGTNIQEGALLHTSHDLPDCIVGKNVTIGHGAIVHGCKVGDNCIIGMGSTILDGAEIGENCIVGANALVPMNMRVPPGNLVLGVPAKVVRGLTPEEIEANRSSAIHYIETGAEYRRYFDR
jgi:carbonic anhydrase/acetyltransferase-like protein (isoleucine patch superfamily)